jgi:hypothetical protein
MIAGLPLRLASRPLQRILEPLRIRHLLAVTANGFGDLHEVGRVDVGAVLEIDFRRDSIRIHLLVHALDRDVFFVMTAMIGRL